VPADHAAAAIAGVNWVQVELTSTENAGALPSVVAVNSVMM
jgi:hypothetical protein